MFDPYSLLLRFQKHDAELESLRLRVAELEERLKVDEKAKVDALMGWDDLDYQRAVLKEGLRRNIAADIDLLVRKELAE